MIGGASGKNKAKNIVSIDVGQGIGVHGGGCGNVRCKYCEFYGENRLNGDCVGVPQASCDHCIDRHGMVLNSIFSEAHRDKETINSEWMPLFNNSDCFTGNV